MKRIEAAEEIAVGGDIGPYGLVHPARPGPAESGAVLTDQPHPFLLGPPPVSGALLRAPAQHQSDRILFQACAVWTNQVPISAGLVGYWPSSARRLRMRWIASAMFSQLPPSGV